MPAPASGVHKHNRTSVSRHVVATASSVACGLAFALTGCGASGPAIAAVEGTVLLDGKPLPLAAVVFVPENGRPAGATTDEAGNFSLSFTEGREGAIPGKNRVLISTKRDPRKDAQGKPLPATAETIPMKYNARTELQFVVEPGQRNIARFELDSKGQVSKNNDDLDAHPKPFASQ